MQPVGSGGCFSLAKPPAKPTSRNDADVKFKSLGWIEIKRYIVAFAEKIQGNAQSPTHRRGNHREDPGQCAFSNSSPWKSQKKTHGNAHSPAHRHGNRRKDRKPASGGSNHDAATKKQKHSCQQSVSTRGNGPSAYCSLGFRRGRALPRAVVAAALRAPLYSSVVAAATARLPPDRKTAKATSERRRSQISFHSTQSFCERTALAKSRSSATLATKERASD